MEQMVDIDERTATEARQLLAVAFSTTPSFDGQAGSELLRQVRRRTSRRQRTMRALVPAGAVTALAGAATAVTLTVTVASAPSAFAAVTAAAAKTSAGSFRVTMSIATNPPPVAGAGRVQAATVTGAFDPALGVGVETVSGPWHFQVRYVGQNTYLETYPGSRQVIFSASAEQGSRPWAQFPPERALAGNALSDAGNSPGGAATNPLTLLRLLRSAGTVTADGPASGPGWTGTKYEFTVTVNKQATTGYLDVDGQGRVRRLVAELTAGTGRTTWVTASEEVTFSDFGAPVSVSAPPASQVSLLKGPVAMIALGW